MPLRIMFLSDRIIGGSSAYSRVTFETATRLVKMGYRVAHIPMGMSNKMGKWDYQGILIYPSGASPFGEDVALEHYLDFKADLLITLKEPWVFSRIPQVALNFCPMVPIDHEPVSPWITSKLHTAFNTIAISRFGQRELEAQGVKTTYIPHGVNSEVFRPLEDKAECRKLWYLNPDEFVVGIVAMNRSRKMISRQLRIYKKFLELNPDVKSHLLLWTDVEPQVHEEEALPIGVADVGVYLLPEIMQLGLGEKVQWVRWKEVREMGGLPDWSPTGWCMSRLYNSLDVLLNTTGGEGAGLTQLEANACGVPVITTDYAGGPEYCYGLVVPPSDYIIFATPGIRYALADIDKGAQALTKICNSGSPEKLQRNARTFAEKMDWKNVIDLHWKPFLDACSEELYPKISREGVSTWA